VLIIEDNRDSRESLRMVVECWGHIVEVAADGLQGVQTALDWRPETAIVDIGLPLVDGFRVAEQLRATLRETIFLIALTGYHTTQERDRALDCGFDVFLPKPADLDRLANLLCQRGVKQAQPHA
jgi:DNA-binding response OmpR family regulator